MREELMISRLTTDHIAAAMRLSTQAGWNQLPIDWERLISNWPERCVGGWVGQTLVATSTVARYEGGLAWIGMVLVDEAYRGRGLGKTIFDAAMTRIDSPIVGLDASDAGRLLYLKRGFVDAAKITRWTGIAERQSSATETHSLDPQDDARWQAAMRLDREQFGFDRSSLLKRLAGEPANLGICCIDEAKISGFAFVRPGRTAFQVGPIVASSPAIANSLLSGALDRLKTTSPGARVQVDVVEQENGFSQTLARSGLVATRHLTRMFLDRVPTRPPACQAAAGFELG